MANTDVLDVTPIDPGLAEAVWPLSIEAGWNQNVADWRFMLAAGRGFGCRGADGKWQASSLVLPLGQKLFLEIDRQVGGRAGPNRRQGGGVFLRVDGDPDDAGAGGVQRVDLLERGGHVGGVGGGHTLGGDGVAGPDRNRSDPHFPRGISLHLDHGPASRQTGVLAAGTARDHSPKP